MLARAPLCFCPLLRAHAVRSPPTRSGMRPAHHLFIGGIVFVASGLVSLLFLSPAALSIWLLVVLLIVDTGAGVPLIWVMLAPFLRPFKPSAAYRQLKSKFVLRT